LGVARSSYLARAATKRAASQRSMVSWPAAMESDDDTFDLEIEVAPLKGR